MMKKLLAVFLAVALGVSLVTPVVAEESAAEKTYAAMQELFRAWPDADIEAALTEEQLALTLGEVLSEEQVTALDEILTEAERTFPQEEEAAEEPVPEEPEMEELTEPETPGEDQEEGGEPEPQAVPNTETKDTAALTVGELFAILQAREPEAAEAVLAVLMEEEEEPAPEEPVAPEEPTTPEEPAEPEGPAEPEQPEEPAEAPEIGAVNFLEVAPLLMLSQMPAANGDDGRVDNDGIVTSKTVTQDEDGYKLRLESYVTGTSTTTTVTEQVPTDIVLVLDQSTSMSKRLTGGQTRLNALKSAVSSFADNVAEQARGDDGEYGTADDVDHRIAVVGFADRANNLTNGLVQMDTASGLDRVKNVVGNMRASGNTYPSAGLNVANTIFLQNPIPESEKRNRVIVLFTDGYPAPAGTDNISYQLCDNAIDVSHASKNTYGATVYTIGIFSGANPSSDIDANYQYGSTNQAKQLVAANRYMHYTSSNYQNATSMENGGEKNGDGYYLSAGDAAAINEIFEKISQEIHQGGASVTLGKETVVKDVISDYFTLPEGTDANNINVYTADCIGRDNEVYTFGGETKYQEAEVSIDDKTINVTNFDFSANYVAVDTTTQQPRGKKLIIEIPIKVRDGFWGGNGVPTNGDTSGIYSGETAVENFEVPTVDVPIQEPEARAANQNIYYGGDTPAVSDLYTLTSDFPTTGADAWKTDFVRLEESIEEQTISNTQDGTYTVTVKVEPTLDGTERGTSTEVSATVNVFKPTVTWKDTTIELGDSADYAQNLDSLRWYHEDVEASSVVMVGMAPKLEYTYDPAAGQFQQDTNVAVSVNKIGNVEISNNSGVTFAWSASEDCDCTEGPQNAHFRVHVNVPSFDLTITKHIQDGSQPDQDFVFNVTGEGKTYTVVITKEQFSNGSATATIKALPNGNYTVTEDKNWSWRYVLTGNKSCIVNDESPNAEFTNKRENNNWLSGSSNAVNSWVNSLHRVGEGGNAS